MSRHFGGVSPSRQSQKVRVASILAGVCAFVAFCAIALLVLGSGSSASTPVTPVAQTIEMVDVLVPLGEIPQGVPLEAAMFRKEKRPKVGLSTRAAKDFEEIKGYYSRSVIVGEQPLSLDLITDVKPSSALTANIPEGYRAVTISVDARSSVEGWARPGARVDVLWVSRLKGKEAVTVIVQNAKILSAERQIDGDPQAKGKDGRGAIPSTVTLEVATQDAQKIQLASASGTLSLSLRGDKDMGKGQAVGSITIDDLLGMSKNTDKKDTRNKIRVRGADGKWEEFYFNEGKLEPVVDNGPAKD